MPKSFTRNTRRSVHKTPRNGGKVQNSFRQHIHIGKKGKNKVHKVMHEFKEGKLHSGSKHGPVVTNRKQVIYYFFMKMTKSRPSLLLFQKKDMHNIKRNKFFFM